jgi:glutathione S-transferase
MSARLELLTFAPMVDSETARLLARYYGLAIDEHDHLFGWASLLTLLHGGYGQVPLLHGPGVHVSGPWAIAKHFDAALPDDRQLIPGDAPLTTQAAADWARYNGGLGADVAVFAYFHLLPEQALMAPIFAAPVPPGEARLVPRVYGLLKGLFQLLLQLSPTHAAAAADRIRACFDVTDKRIADGRRHLCPERLTLGVGARAGARPPLLLPRGYGALMPPLEAMPAPVRALATELRARPTAAFVQALYDGELAAAA